MTSSSNSAATSARGTVPTEKATLREQTRIPKKVLIEAELIPVAERFASCAVCDNRIDGELADRPTIRVEAFPALKGVLQIDVCRSCAAALESANKDSGLEARLTARERVDRWFIRELRECIASNNASHWNLESIIAGYEKRIADALSKADEATG